MISLNVLAQPAIDTAALLAWVEKAKPPLLLVMDEIEVGRRVEMTSGDHFMRAHAFGKPFEGAGVVAWYNTRQVSDWNHSPAPSQTSRRRAEMDTPDSTTTKQCRTCGLVKPLSDFYIGTNGKPIPDCKPCRIEQSRVYQRDNAEKVRENHRRWRKENAEHYRQYHRDWRKANQTSARGAVLRYAKSEKGRAVSFNRKARLRGADGKISAEDKGLLRAAQTDKRGRLRCWWCGKPINGTPHLDHKIALAAGGSNDAGNLCYACAPCNQSKSAKSPAEFAGRLL